MPEFRRGLIAFAAVALLLVLGSSAYAQGVNCVANSANPATLRAEGVTELVGDVTIICQGSVASPNGTPTAIGQTVPEANFTILMNTNITSRILSAANSASEAVMTIDEPFPTNNGGPVPTTATLPATSPTTQLGCLANNSVNCATTGTGGGIGPSGPYSGAAGHPNIFQGTWNAVFPNAISWTGVPVDAPGTGTRIIRITNVRANASLLGLSSTLIPAIVTELITITGSQNITLSNPQPTVGVIQRGLTSSVGKALTLQQCVTVNGTVVSSTSTGGTTASPIGVLATEGFSASFKPRNFSQYGNPPNPAGSANTPATPAASSTAVQAQNVLGFPYNSESGFVPTASVSGLTNPSVGGTGAMGLADSGTEITFQFGGVPAGLISPNGAIVVPNQIPLFPVGTVITTSLNASTGVVTITAVTPGSSPVTQPPTGVAQLLGAAATGTTTLTVATGATSATYEVLLANSSIQEFAFLPVTVAFLSNTTSNLPGTTTSPATVAVNLAPLSTVPTAATSSVPIPRFLQPYPGVSLFSINACTCDLLFPFVTNQAGFDTGVAIANTSLDPFKTPLQSGNVTLNYYGTTTGGGAAPAAATTTSVVAAGAELVFTLSGGGTNGIAATPGFQGYIIAVAQFQFCHGFAFITDGIGTSTGIAEGYLAIQLDTPSWIGVAGTRTGNVGESQGQ
jgi:hypothetical protein